MKDRLGSVCEFSRRPFWTRKSGKRGISAESPSCGNRTRVRPRHPSPISICGSTRKNMPPEIPPSATRYLPAAGGLCQRSTFQCNTHSIVNRRAESVWGGVPPSPLAPIPSTIPSGIFQRGPTKAGQCQDLNSESLTGSLYPRFRAQHLCMPRAHHSQTRGRRSYDGPGPVN